MNLATVIENASKATCKFCKKNSRAILTAGTVIGVCTTAVLAVGAGIKAEKILAEKKKSVGLPEDEKLPVKEVIKETWKEFVPVVISAAGTAACGIGSNIIATNTIETMKVAYNVLQQGYDAYKESVAEETGPKKADQIEATACKKVMEENSVAEMIEGEMCYLANGGDVRIYEPLSGRVIVSDPEFIREVANDMNSEMIEGEMCYSANHFFTEIGLTQIDLGEDRGWNCSKEHQIALHFVPTSLTDNGGVEKLAWCIVYDKPPVYNYDCTWGYTC